MKYFIHYTVLAPNGPDKLKGVTPTRLVAGPYTMNEAFAKKLELEPTSMNVYIEEETP